MASEGPKSPSSAGGTWSNPTNILTSDNAYATSTGGGQEIYAYGFGFSSIPAGAVLDGIVVEGEIKCASSFALMDWRLYADAPSSTGGGTTKSFIFTTTEGYSSQGGPTDTCGMTMADVRQSSFGWRATLPGTNPLCSIDHIRITVYYTTASGYSFAQVMG